jgi:DNA-binding response OmpR family regulator
MLGLEGYRVIATADASEALAEIERALPRLILLDLWLPFGDGRALARELRARAMRIPMVVVSAAPDGDISAREIGAEGFLAKPFDRDDLLSAVRQLYS